MTDHLDALPDSPRLFEGSPAERYLALSLEAVVQDVSLDGATETAMQLGGFMLGESPPPSSGPEYVELSAGKLRLSNPPFLMADIDCHCDEDAITITAEFDSWLDLLIDPPVTVTYRGTIQTVVADLEQTIAEIYRTKGRHLEKIDSGVVKR